MASTMLPTKAQSCGRPGVNPGAVSLHQTTASAARSICPALNLSCGAL
jgi:hypothetical protein